MSLQNRVDPWGQLNRSEMRGQWLGNRGILHDENQEIVAQWRHKAWVTCALEFKGVQRKVFSPNHYSELFFLDEAAALSAGHRPCATCRRASYKQFKALWCQANLPQEDFQAISVTKIDQQLHAERMLRGGGKVLFPMRYEQLVPGVFIEIDGEAFLYWNQSLQQWSAKGYRPTQITLHAQDVVSVLTPKSIVQVLQLGYKPQVHASVL